MTGLFYHFVGLLLLAMLRRALCQSNWDYDTANISDTSQLRVDIIDAHDHRFRPISNQSSPMVVEVEFHLYQILHVDELEMKMRTSCAFHFSWTDEFRVWSLRNYAGLSVIYPDPRDVWRPRVFISNSLEDRDVFKDDYAHLSLRWNGRTRWQPGIIMSSSCNLDLRFYPFDDQVCSIVAVSSSFSRHLVFKKLSTTAFIDEYTANGEWTLLKTEIEQDDVVLGYEKFSRLKVNCFLRRDPGYFLINSLLPTMMLSFLSIMVFVLPRGSGERAGYSMTVMMSLSLVQSTVLSELPQTPQMLPFIVMYLISLVLLSWVVVVVTVLTLVCHNKNEQGQQVEQADDKSLDHVNDTNCSKRETFPNLDSGFTDGKEESLKANNHDDPLTLDEHYFHQKKHHNFVFLRKNKRVRPDTPENSDSFKDNSLPCTVLCNTSFGHKLKSLFNKLISDVDVILFSIFLLLWVALTMIFLVIVKSG